VAGRGDDSHLASRGFYPGLPGPRVGDGQRKLRARLTACAVPIARSFWENEEMGDLVLDGVVCVVDSRNVLKASRV
jgi:hypothetical protein